MLGSRGGPWGGLGMRTRLAAKQARQTAGHLDGLAWRAEFGLWVEARSLEEAQMRRHFRIQSGCSVG